MANFQGITFSFLLIGCFLIIFAKGCRRDEKNALLSLEKDVVFSNGGSFRLSNGSTDDEDCCKWLYVSCNQDGHVNKINFYDSTQHLMVRGNNSLNPIMQQFRYLEDLRLRRINFGGVHIPEWIRSFTKLSSLDLSYCNFSGRLPLGLFNLVQLAQLDLSYNNLEGQIPEAFGNLNFLSDIDLKGNLLQGGIPASLGNLCALQTIDVSSNFLSGDFGDLLRNLSIGCTSSSLRNLHLGSNHITGSIPDSIVTFSYLGSLSLASNKLNGTVSPNIGQLTHLEDVDLSGNALSGVMSETHFANLTLLDILDLSNNALTLNFSSTWSPKFTAEFIGLRSCKLGPLFPTWLQSQLGALSSLDISAAGIFDTIPDWFFNYSSDSMTNICYLNMSYNQIQGHLPRQLGPLQHESCPYVAIDFGSNLLQGLLPSVLKNIDVIDLSNNSFSGEISSICDAQDSDFKFIDFSQNLLFGEVPNHCFAQYESLKVLNFANNKFSGRLPTSLWYLPSLKMLNLRANNFSGDMPPFSNCTKLEFLDLSYNRLSGAISTWIGRQLPSLMFLNLGSNQFIGSIPTGICRLKNLRILNLAMNNLSGTLPSCLDQITVMAYKQNLTATLKEVYGSDYETIVMVVPIPIDDYIYNAVLMWRGKEEQYSRILGYLILIDVSDNRLTGEIPTGIVHLEELVALNLSRNHFSGSIPADFGKLNNIQLVDLSRNQLSGHIPSSVSELTFLSLLDLSYNNLSGEIPSSTQILGFDPLWFAGNPALCGLPTKFRCQNDNDDHAPNAMQVGEDEEEDEFHKLFYVGSAVGFVTGFWLIFGTLLLKHSWRHAYFRLLDEVADTASLAFILSMRKLKARLR